MIFKNKTKEYRCEIKDKISHGNFGIIFKVFDKNNRSFALKFLSIDEKSEPKLKKEMEEQYGIEVEVMKEMNIINIL